MKWTESKQLAGYIALVQRSTLLAGFAVQSVAMLVNKYWEKFLRIRLCLAPAQDPTQTFG